MSVDVQRTVAELALEKPQAAGVFERLGIDYCCDGRASLQAACESAGLDVTQVARVLEESGEEAGAVNVDWRELSLASLIDHIVSKHHAYCRRECQRLEPLLAKVMAKHAERYPELERVQALFAALSRELNLHLNKEEGMLFPCIVRLEEVAVKSALTRSPFGSVQNPVRMMIHEHDNAGHLINGIRGLTARFTAPPDACNSFRALYQGLEAFAADLHQHVHLENNVLFPRAIALEEGLGEHVTPITPLA
jgi:regulator of cell morphogenesis and NO signaling